MLEADIRLLSPAKMTAMAKFYGLAQRGKRGIWVVRKSVTDPRTRVERVFKRSTKTADLRLALHRATTWVDDFMVQVHGNRLPTLPKIGQWASLQQIEQHYLRAAVAAPSTRKKNWACLMTMVKEMVTTDDKHPPESYSSEIFDGRFVRLWQLRRKEAAEALLPNAAECERAKRGANACYRKARSVFSAALLRSYEDAGLRLPPTAREFSAQGFLPAAKPPPSEQLRPEVLARLVRVLPKLKRVRPGIYAALLLMWRGGLRNSETEKARRSWLLPSVGGGYVLRLSTAGEYKPKAKDRIVALSEAVVRALLELPQLDSEPDAYLVPSATAHERRENCNRRLNKLLRAVGVSDIKGKLAYRLRGHAITEQMLLNGMDAAQAFAGHTSRTTTAIYLGTQTQHSALPMPV